jgi:hypothetical protein
MNRSPVRTTSQFFLVIFSYLRRVRITAPSVLLFSSSLFPSVISYRHFNLSFANFPIGNIIVKSVFRSKIFPIGVFFRMGISFASCSYGKQWSYKRFPYEYYYGK